METLPSSWTALCALAFVLGVKHGVDADHLATVDGITRHNSGLRPRLARYAGTLFSLGHGAVVVAIAMAAAAATSAWQAPHWLEITGVTVSLLFLFGLAALNLRAVVVTKPCEVVRPATIRGRLLGRVLTVQRPWAVAAVGALFAVSFDTVSQAALMSLAAGRFGGLAHALIVAVLFVAGMLVVDGINGACLARLVRNADRTAVVASRVMALGVGALSLAVGLFTVAKLAFPRVDTWADGRELQLGASVAVGVIVAFAASVVAARRQSIAVVTASRLRWLAAVLLVPLAVELAAHGDHGKSADRGESRPPDGLGASAAFDASGTLWAVAKGGNHVVLRSSADLGQTWSWGKAVNIAPEPVGADGDARPKVAVGPKGELYVSWTPPLAKPSPGFIRFARSLDRGNTFSAPVTVQTDRQEITQLFDGLTVDRDGRIFIAWSAKREGEAARGKREAHRGAAMHFAVSDDRGASFRGDFKVADQSCECCSIALLPRGDGSVTAFWRHAFAPNLRDHAIASLHADGRVDGLRRAGFDNRAIDACPQHPPVLADDPTGRLHAVWFARGSGQTGASYGRLREGSVEGVRRIGGATAEQPDLAVVGNAIAVAWKESDGKRVQLRGMRSDDGGSTWRDLAIATTDGDSDRPQLLAYQGRFFVYWNTRAKLHSIYPLP